MVTAERTLKVQTIEGTRTTWSEQTFQWVTTHKEDNDKTYWLKTGMVLCACNWENDKFYVRTVR